MILRENEVIHESAIEPALVLLSNHIFTSASDEFMEALQHYRKGEYGDCLTKVGSSMESVMKIICHERGWNYNQTDPFKKLLDTVLQESGLESFFEQPIMLIGTLRNRLSGSHGAGVQAKNVTKEEAQYAVNMSASTMVFLIQECGLAT